MNTETLARTAVGRVWVRAVAAGMESRLRYRLFGPVGILRAAAVEQGRSVLEIGCGTGYFTIPAGRMLGERGSLVAMDILRESVDEVSRRAGAAGLTNIRVVKGDALKTGQPSGAFDMVLLFGVVPAPMVPLVPLLAEIRRVLKPGGTLSVWPHVPGWLPRSVVKTGAFRFSGRRQGVDRFTRC